MGRWVLIRDIATWAVGVLVLAHEVVVREDERPYIIILIAGLLGLPVFLHQDGQASQSPGPGAPSPKSPDQGTP